jgi:hypothetical protein
MTRSETSGFFFWTVMGEKWLCVKDLYYRVKEGSRTE